MSIELKLDCKDSCLFHTNCGVFFRAEHQPCQDNVNAIVSAIDNSLQENPVLDPEREVEYSGVEVSTTFLAYPDPDEVRIKANLLMKQTDKTVAIDLGKVKRGYLNINSYGEEIFTRIKGKAPVTKVTG